MRTILAGIRALRRTPLAGVPFALEGLLVALLVGANALPAAGGTSPAIAAFPFDVYFDVREALTHGHDWAWFVAIIVTSILFRSLIFSSALWFADGARSPFALAWARAAKLTAIAAAALVPSAAIFFTGTAIRYAPFIWVGALLGLVPACVLARRAVRLDTGVDDAPAGKGVPELFAFLSYAYLIAVIGYAVDVLGQESTWLAALLLACGGPVHAVFFLGWREHVRAETFPGGGFLAAAATVALVGLLFVTAAYDRYLRDPPPVGRAGARGTLLLLGGVDSTATTGALSEFDPRRVGFRDDSTTRLSYRGPDRRYSRADTRGDLAAVARAVSPQIDDARAPTYLLGHSQAAVIVDRLVSLGGETPTRAVVLAPSPPNAPPVVVPGPDEDGEGKPGGDLARGFATVIDLLGMTPFDIDAGASPVRLGSEVVSGGPPRLAIWAIGDSVWLYDDWKRPGETNVVAMSDHVGVTNNARALDVAKRFFEGKEVKGDAESWRGGLASLIGHAFAPWRPDR